MNILFFLKPKSETAYVYDYGTLRQVLETMEYHKYASIPMLNKEGEYVGTITEGDLLWGIKRYTNLNLKEAENIYPGFPQKGRLCSRICRLGYGGPAPEGDESEFRPGSG